MREGKRGREKSASGEGDMASRQMGQSVGEWVIGGMKVVRCWVRKWCFVGGGWKDDIFDWMFVVVVPCGGGGGDDEDSSGEYYFPW